MIFQLDRPTGALQFRLGRYFILLRFLSYTTYLRGGMVYGIPWDSWLLAITNQSYLHALANSEKYFLCGAHFSLYNGCIHLMTGCLPDCVFVNNFCTEIFQLQLHNNQLVSAAAVSDTWYFIIIIIIFTVVFAQHNISYHNHIT